MRTIAFKDEASHSSTHGADARSDPWSQDEEAIHEGEVRTFMKNPDNLARRNLWNAVTRIKSAELFYGREEWPDVIRECREALDFSFKSLLHAQGMEINRFQNPGEVFSKERQRFPSAIPADWDRIGKIVSPEQPQSTGAPFAGAGDFMTFGEDSFSSSPADAPSQESAQAALSDARYILDLARSLGRHLSPRYARQT